MNADIYGWVAGVAQLLLMLLGVIVSLLEERVKKHKGVVLSAFAVLGIAGFTASV